MGFKAKLALGALGLGVIAAISAPMSEAQTRQGAVRTTVSPPKLVSTKVTETRRVTTVVGRPKVQTTTRVATRIDPVPAQRTRAQAGVSRAAGGTDLAQAPSRALSPGAARADEPTTPGLRDMAKTRFRTGEFFD